MAPISSLGRWGLPVNIAAVAYGTLVAINIASPRNSVYNALGTPHWYWQWSPVLFIGGIVIIGSIYYAPSRPRSRRRCSLSTAPTSRCPCRAPAGDAFP